MVAWLSYHRTIEVLGFDQRPKALRTPQDVAHAADVPIEAFDPDAFDGLVLLLEYNFVIAKDMKDQLEESGIVAQLC